MVGITQKDPICYEIDDEDEWDDEDMQDTL